MRFKTASPHDQARYPANDDRGSALATFDKGQRSKEIVDAMKRNKAVYLAATGGAAVLLAKSIKSSKIIAYEDLGTEAVRELYV